MGDADQNEESSKNSGKTRHHGAPCEIARALVARENSPGWVDDATGGSAVPQLSEDLRSIGISPSNNIRMAMGVKEARARRRTKVDEIRSGSPLMVVFM